MLSLPRLNDSLRYFWSRACPINKLLKGCLRRRKSYLRRLSLSKLGRDNMVGFDEFHLFIKFKYGLDRRDRISQFEIGPRSRDVPLRPRQENPSLTVESFQHRRKDAYPLRVISPLSLEARYFPRLRQLKTPSSLKVSLNLD